MCGVYWNRGPCAVCDGIGDHVQFVLEWGTTAVE